MNIVVLDGYTLNSGDLNWDELKELGTCNIFDRISSDRILEQVQDAEAILVNKVELKEEFLKKLPKLKYIGVLATGYNNIDVRTCKELKITVTNVPGYSTESVAQTAFALILELTHRAGHHSHSVHEGKWSVSPDFAFWDFPLIELHQKTIGIIGYGTIGQAVARIARGFGMNVFVFTRTPKNIPHSEIQFVDLDQVFSQSDIITLHCPLTEKTKGLIDSGRLSQMKKRAYLINTARGALIDEEALRDALIKEQIAGAGLDVLSEEPPKKSHPLIGVKNCIITPHYAWATTAARERLMNAAVDNLRCFIKNRPKNVIS
jgi:glycerate dehydrogenase